jgi:hypothetical protein
MLVAAVALLPHQHQRHISLHCCAGDQAAGRRRVDQFTGSGQVTFTALQGSEQLLLRLGDDLEGDRLALARIPIEVLLERVQAMVFGTDRLALNLAGAVATLIDQYPQHFAAAYLREVAGCRFMRGLGRAGGSCLGGKRRGQAQAQQDSECSKAHAFSSAGAVQPLQTAITR